MPGSRAHRSSSCSLPIKAYSPGLSLQNAKRAAESCPTRTRLVILAGMAESTSSPAFPPFFRPHTGVRFVNFGPIFSLRSEEHTSELQSLMSISYAVFCLKKQNTQHNKPNTYYNNQFKHE